MADHCREEVCGSNNFSGVVFFSRVYAAVNELGTEMISCDTCEAGHMSDTCYCFDA